MSWPKGRPRPRKVDAAPEAAAVVPVEETEHEEQPPRDPTQPPADWRKGALLNVRNHGEHYIITLWPEEYRPDQEERCVKFTNLGECQGFVSHWYARETADPRAR